MQASPAQDLNQPSIVQLSQNNRVYELGIFSISGGSMKNSKVLQRWLLASLMVLVLCLVGGASRQL
jgi:hypothetical protein